MHLRLKEKKIKQGEIRLIHLHPPRLARYEFNTFVSAPALSDLRRI